MGTICHVQLFVVSGCVMRRGWGCGPVDIRYGGCSGIAPCTAGYRRIATGWRTLCYCQRDPTHKQCGDDCESLQRHVRTPKKLTPTLTHTCNEADRKTHCF